MFCSICWIAGFTGIAFLLLSLLFSARRYISLFGFEETSSRICRNLFYVLFSLLILVTVFSNQFIKRENIYNVLSIIAGAIGVISFGLGFWVLSNVHVKDYKGLLESIQKKEQADIDDSDEDSE